MFNNIALTLGGVLIFLEKLYLSNESKKGYIVS